MIKLICPECRRENEAERIYCHDCGARLDRTALAKEPPKGEDVKETQRRLKNLLDPSRAKMRQEGVRLLTLQDDTDPMISVMKLDKAPTESYADIGGLELQIQEIKVCRLAFRCGWLLKSFLQESVELPLTHPELYEEMGIKPPKGVILYGVPGTGKTLLAKAVAHQTSATFLRVVGSELIQKYLGDGPKLVRELFRVAEEHAPSIVFIDEIDAIGTKR